MPDPLIESATLEMQIGFRLQWESETDTYILLYPGGLETLDSLSTAILVCCDGAHTLVDIANEINAVFPGEEARSRIYKFINAAYQNGWIVTY